MKNNGTNMIRKKKIKFPFLVFFFMILLAGGLLFVWYNFVIQDEAAIIEDKKNELLTIVDFKVNQIVNWRNERYADAEVIKNDPAFKKELNTFLKNNINYESKANIIYWLQIIRDKHDYENIYVLDALGKIRMSLDTNNLICLSVNSLIDSAKSKNKILFTDFYKDFYSHVHLSLVIPLFIADHKSSSFIGSVVLIINPNNFILPLIQSWPIPSKSSEIILFKRKKDSIHFLNKPRLQKHSSLNIKLSIKDTNILGVKAVRGNRGISMGVDYRNINVMGAISLIPDCGWYLVAKTDWEEIYSPLRQRKIISFIMIFSLIAGMCIAFGFYLVRQQALYYRKNYEMNLEKQLVTRTLRGIIESTDDLIYSLDKNYFYTSFNQNHAVSMKNVYNSDIKIGTKMLDYITVIEEKNKVKNNIDIALSGIRVFEESCSGDNPLNYSYFETMYHPINDTTGNVIGVSIFAKNITKRKQAEQSLLLKNLVFDSSIAANSISDIEGNITEINSSFTRLWGYVNREEIIGKPISLFIRDLNVIESVINSLNQTGKWAGEFVAIKKDGSNFLAEGIATIVKDLNGNMIGYQSSIMDITERKIAEEALRESERELKEVQSIANMGSWYWDVKTGFVKWSDETYKIFHLNPKEFTPQIDSILALSPWPGDHERGQELINRAIETHTPGFYEQRFLRSDNSIGYYISTFKGKYDATGELVSIIGSILDITERKKAEEALRESEEKFRNIFESATVGKSITSTDGKLKTNKTYNELLGYSEEELSILNWQDITHPDDISRDAEILKSILNKERPSARWKKRYIHKNGNIVWADISTVLHCDSNGDPLYFITSIIDITSEILAQEELYRSRERFVRAMENIPDIIVIYDNELKILFINDATKNLTGRDSIDFIGKKDEEIWPPEIYEPYIPILHEAFETKRTTSIDTEILFTGFGKRNLHIVCVPVLNEKNEILEVIGITHDYTERKKSEDLIQERDKLLEYEQEKLKTLLDISTGLYIANTFKEIGRTISDILKKYQIGESVGIKLSVYDIDEDNYEVAYFTGESDEELKNAFLYANKPNSLKDVMYYSKIAIEQRKTLYIEDNHSEYSLGIDKHQENLVRSSLLFIPLFNEDVLIGLLSFARSPESSMAKEFILFLETIAKHTSTAISKLLSDKKRKKIEQEIIQSENRYHSLFENMLEGLAYCQMIFENEKPVDFVYLEVNRSFESLTGLTNVIGRNVTEVIPGIRESSPELFEFYARVAFASKPESFEIFLAPLKKWFSVSAYSPKKGYFVAVFNNITQRKIAEMEILKLNEELEKRVEERTAKLESANKDLESFSYSVSHDLRAPLRAINGFSQILVNRHKINLNNEGMHFLDNIIEASDRMSRLIEDILTYSRLGRKSLSHSPVNIKELLDKIVSDYQNVIEENQSEIIVSNDLPVIDTDRTLLNTILVNLIDNAIKYHKKDILNKIYIEYLDQGNQHVFRIKDSGIGIESEYKEKIFDVFQRLHNEDEFPGTGIGLSLVKKSAAMLKGEVYLEDSVKDVGSIFILKLPKEENHE